MDGFWDGGDSFKIRFAPTREGAWSYRTSSANPGLNNQSGEFACVRSPEGNHGFLRIDAHHPYSFVWDDGTRYFMWCQTFYDVMQPAMVNDNWKASIEKSVAYGMNKVRMHVHAQNFYEPGVEFTKYPDVQPYMGDSKNPNRDQLNNAYWKKLDEMVQFMADRGIVTDLIVTNPYWDNRQFGTAVQNDRLVRYVAARYAAYANVIWCLANEWDLSAGGNHYKGTYRQTKADFDRMGKVLRNADAWMSESDFLRPLSIHNTTKDFEFFGSGWPTNIIIQYGGWNPDYDNGDEWGNGGIVHNLGHNMPVVNDEYGYFGQINPKPKVRINMTREKLRGAIWGIATAGGYGSAGDFRITANGMGNVEITGDWLDATEEYGDLKRMIGFFTTKGFEYWKMSSQNGLVAAGTRIYILAETGREYIIYVALGGEFSVGLAPGSYKARLFDPTDGTDTSLGTVGSGIVKFAVPTSHDYVVYLSVGS